MHADLFFDERIVTDVLVVLLDNVFLVPKPGIALRLSPERSGLAKSNEFAVFSSICGS